ncbi:MAG TPA: hypothetical protein VF159_03010 [Gemmatimonadaceae bacterium]
MRVEYLGVGGMLVSYRGHSLLTAPMFSNPTLGAVLRRRVLPWGSGPVRPDTALIDSLLPRAADSASMILVGHGHYDHLLDVPYIARRHATSAAIYGGPTVRHILMGDSTLRAEAARVVAIDSTDVATLDHRGRWFYSADSAFRVMALLADHAPTVKMGGLQYLFAGGQLTQDLATWPTYADEWRLGEPLAFLVDVLRPRTHDVRLRLYYQDAPNTPPLGFPPRAEVDARPVDVAILCAATAENVPNAPDSLLRLLRPPFVLVGHWESFFRSRRMSTEVNSETNTGAFEASLARVLPASSSWVMPAPGTTLEVDGRR